MSNRQHPNGRPYGMSRRDYRMLKQSGSTIEDRVQRQTFDADVKTRGLGEAMRMHGILEDSS